MNQVVSGESQVDTQIVRNSKQFHQLLIARNSIRYILTTLVIAIHGFFIGGIAFYNEWFGQPYKENSIIPNGIYFTVLVIILMVLLEFVYILLSEKKIQKLQDKVVSEVINND